MQIRFISNYKSGELLSTSYWKSNGDSVSYELINISEQEKKEYLKIYQSIIYNHLSYIKKKLPFFKRKSLNLSSISHVVKIIK